MASVRDILRAKGSHVLSVGPGTTVLDAATLMNEHKIGSLVVVEGGQLIGIITERDILRRIVVPRLDAGTTLVEAVMTTELACCQPHTRIDEARGVMKNRRIRHLPVLDEERQLCGMVSIGDLNAWDSHDQEVTIHVLEEYIHGRV